MQSRFSFINSPIRDRIVWLTVGAGLIIFRLAIPPRNDFVVGIQAIVDLAWTVAFWFVVLLTAISAGRSTLQRFFSTILTQGSLTFVLAVALGLGETALVLTGFVLLGILSQEAIVILLLLACAAFGPQMSSLLRVFVTELQDLSPRWQMTSWYGRITFLMILTLSVLSLLNALTPPWDYDGLMYHLVGPLRLLEDGYFRPDLGNWYVNGPLNIEMLFTVGLALGDDVFPKLIHYTYGLIFIASTFLFARRWLSSKAGQYALLLLIGIPTIPIWAGFAYIDLGWAAYEFLAIACFIEWSREEEVGWIALGGVFTGFAMGSKYLGLMGFAVLGIFIAFAILRKGIRTHWTFLLWFALPAIVISSPWYLKNLILFANPVYPLFLGGPGWSTERLANYSAYLESFGTGLEGLEIFLLPLKIYTNHSEYGAAVNRNDIPSLFFPLIIVYPFLKRTPLLNTLLGISIIRFILWTFGSQQIRFLLPIYPLLAIVCAYTIDQLSENVLKRPSLKIFLPTLTLGLTFISVFYQIQYLRQYQSLDAVFGRESRDDFLARAVGDYQATRFILGGLEGTRTVMMLGDGRGYYCLPRCVPDPDHFRWAGEISTRNEGQSLASWFSEHGFTHVLISWEDLDFLLQHDPNGVMHSAARELLAWKEDGCLIPVYESRWAEVNEIRCFQD